MKRSLVDYIRHTFELNVRASCLLLGLSRTIYTYQLYIHKEEEVIITLSELVEKYPRYGFPKLFRMLSR